MAGKERRGAKEASADLFSGQIWVLTPVESAALDTDAAHEIRYWLARIGARVAVLDCEAHDGIVALTSHLSVIGIHRARGSLAKRLLDGQAAISGSGLRDMTRLALSSYDLAARHTCH